ncbi:MAG: hypothetical protein ACI4PJ_03865, partial [Acutalibacteraceae bacterium]
MKNSKYKKVLALVLSSSFIMPCHAGKPQYIQNPNTGLQVRRALPSSEETNNRTQKHIKKSSNYDTLLWLIITAIGVGCIAKKCHSHNNNGVPIFFNRRKDLVERYKLPVNSYNNICLNKLRVYVHKDICGKLKEQQILYVRHCENKILPNVRYGDFFPCATHIYLNNKCVSDSNFNAADYRLISDDQLKLFALKCIWGLNAKNGCYISEELSSYANEEKTSDDEKFEIDIAVNLLKEAESRLEKNSKKLNGLYQMLNDVSILSLEPINPDTAGKKEAGKKEVKKKEAGKKEEENSPADTDRKDSGESKKPEEILRAGNDEESVSSSEEAPKALGSNQKYDLCLNAKKQLIDCIADINFLLTLSQAPGILDRYQKTTAKEQKKSLEKLEKLVGKLLLIRAKYEKSLSTCEAYIE